MGGYGSGAWRTTNRKMTVDESLSLDILLLGQEGHLVPGHSGRVQWTLGENVFASVSLACKGDRLVLSYRISNDGQIEHVLTELPLQTTSPGFGGIRYWFKCPLDTSQRKLSKLYLPPRAKVFGCRECHGLTYASCQNSPWYQGTHWQDEKSTRAHLEYFKNISANLA